MRKENSDEKKDMIPGYHGHASYFLLRKNTSSVKIGNASTQALTELSKPGGLIDRILKAGNPSPSSLNVVRA